MNNEEIGKHSQRITNIKPFVNKYNWEGTNFPSERDNWKNFIKNSVTIALNVLYAKKKLYSAYVSKHNSKREKQVIVVMIQNGKRRHYLELKKLSALLRGIASTCVGDFCCLNCLHSFRTKIKLVSHKNVSENLCNVMPSVM